MIGKNQNDISDLPNLEMYRYENIFKVYEDNFYFYNILKKVTIPDDINNEYFFTYVLQSNIPLTTLSYQAYGTTYLWWLICIVNKIQNPNDTQLIGKTLKIIKKEYIRPIMDSIKTQIQ